MRQTEEPGSVSRLGVSAPPVDGPDIAREESSVSLMRRAAFLAVADAAAKACAFVAAIVAARFFGESGFGALNFAQAVATFVLVAGGSWLDTYAVKAATQAPERLGAIATTVVRLRLALGSGAFVAVTTIAWFFAPLHAVFPLILVYSLSVFTQALSLQWITQAVRKTHLMGIAFFTAQAIYLSLFLVLLQLTGGTWTVPVALVIGELIAAIGLWRWGRRSVTWFAEPVAYRDALAFLRRAAPVGVANLLRGVALGSDLVIVGMLLTLTDAGAYAAAFKIYLLGVTAISLYMIVSFPKIVRVAGAQPSDLSRQLMLSTVILLVVGSPALIGGTVFASDLLGWLFGSHFAAGGASLRILLATLVLYAVTSHLRNALLAFEKQRIDLLPVGVSAVVHVMVKVGLVARFGMEGVALGTLIGEATLLVLTMWIYRRVVRAARDAPVLIPVGMP